MAANVVRLSKHSFCFLRRVFLDDFLELPLDSVRIMTLSSLVQGSKSLSSHLVKAYLLPCPCHLELPFARSIVIFLCLVGMISSSLLMSRKAAHTILECQVDD